MEESSEVLITYHIDTLDGSAIPITSSDAISIAELKQKILNMTGIPLEKLRLLRKGKILSDNEIISQSDITSRIQLVANLHEEEDIVSMISQYNFLRTLRVYRRLSRFSRPILSQPYLFETMRQNSITIDGMIRMKSDDGFQLADRVFEEGQWVDVKDTVGQWLEAQVMRIEYTRRGLSVYIHYNGWPERWDEWIDAGSSRIRPFRSKTCQSLNMASRSPFPVYPPETNSTDENQLDKATAKACFYVEFIQSLVSESRILSKSVEEGKEEAKEHINNLALHTAPVIDRIGRFMIDLSHAISRTRLNSSRRALL